MTVGSPSRRVFHNPFTRTQFQLYMRCISNVWFNLQSSKNKEHSFDGVQTNEWLVLYTHTTNIMGATCIIHLYTSYTISILKSWDWCIKGKTSCFTYIQTSVSLISLNFLGECPVILSEDNDRLSAGQDNDHMGHTASWEPGAKAETS